jgi:exosortase A
MANSPTLTTRPVSPAWRQAGVALVVLLGWILFLYRDTGVAMVDIWMNSDTFTHGFMVPPIVAWLVWRRRQFLVRMAPQPNVWAAVLLAGALFVWLLGDLVAVNALTQLALVSALVLLVPALLGLSVARAIAFPLAFLFFAVPFGEFAMPQLMVWTADFTVAALRLSGIPVYREGLQFVIPSGNWSVVEACSGVRYLIASLTVGTLFAYLNYQSTRRRVLFIIVSILVPVVANWLRAYLIVMLGHLSGNKLAAGVDHLIYGWVFFGVVIIIMFIIGARWSEPEPSLTPFIPANAANPAQANPLAGIWSPTRFGVVALALAGLLAAPLFARLAIDQSANHAAPQLSSPAALSAGWAVSPVSVVPFQPDFQNPSAQLNTTYTQGTASVGLYVAYYRQQDYRRKLVSSENVLVKTKDASWTQVARGTRAVSIGNQTIPWRTAELRGSPVPGQANDERLVAWQIYWVNGTFTASDSLAKAYGAFYRLLGRGDDSAAIVVYAPKGQAGQGDAALTTFMQANGPALQTLLEQTRSFK